MYTYIYIYIIHKLVEENDICLHSFFPRLKLKARLRANKS